MRIDGTVAAVSGRFCRQFLSSLIEGAMSMAYLQALGKGW